MRTGVVETDEANALSKKLGFPLLVRPSYVLGGQRMKIVINEDELERHVIDIFRDMPDNKVLLDHYLDGAIECEADAICDGDEVRIIGIMQHIEPAGIHSGDSYAVLPPYNLGDLIISQIEEYTKRIALALETVGLINIQFAVRTTRCTSSKPTRVLRERAIHRESLRRTVRDTRRVMMGEAKLKDLPTTQTDGYAGKSRFLL